MGRLGRLWDGFGTATTSTIVNDSRPWDDGTAEIPHVPTLPVQGSLFDEANELAKPTCGPFSCCSVLLMLFCSRCSMFRDFGLWTLDFGLWMPRRYARYGLVRVPVRVRHQEHSMFTGRGTMVRLQPPSGHPHPCLILFFRLCDLCGLSASALKSPPGGSCRKLPEAAGRCRKVPEGAGRCAYSPFLLFPASSIQYRASRIPHPASSPNFGLWTLDFGL
jgi:hypothetical protein